MSETSTTGQKFAAELLGTFLLVFMGCATVVMSTLTQSPVGYLAVALAFGSALTVATYALGRVSGAHLNPAVTVGAAMSGRMSWGQVPLYAAAQVVGGLVGAGLLLVVVQSLPAGSLPEHTLGQNFFGDGGTAWWGALVVEAVLTAVLVTVILAVTDARNEHPALAPLTIGLTLLAAYLVALPLTGASLNPARSIGPGLLGGTEAVQDLWLFVVAPLVGAALAGLAYPAVFGHGNEPVPGSGLALGRPRADVAGAAVPGYGAPDQFQQEWQQGSTAPVALTYEPEPIIQDGWQWDHQAQEWKPLEHWTNPAESAAAQPAVDAGPFDAGTDTVASPGVTPAVDPAPRQWDPDQTQVRRRDDV